MNWLCAVIAAVLFVIGGVVEVSDEGEFAGLTVAAFLMFGLFFLALSAALGGAIPWFASRK